LGFVLDGVLFVVCVGCWCVLFVGYVGVVGVGDGGFVVLGCDVGGLYGYWC